MRPSKTYSKIIFKIILYFFINSATLRAQLSAPDLRCIKVNPNGEALLSWIIPQGNSNQFDCYLIYNSFSSQGPFTLVDSIFTFTASSYTHTAAAANVQSKYYYVQTRYNNSGKQLSAPSNTLRSIWLSIISISGASDIKLLYNDVHQPKLNSSKSFTISKEYPVGNWNTLRVLNGINSSDTISVCTASLNYQIKMDDASGCVSESNISGGLFNDTKDPDEPVVDSISVLPNGNTILAWHLPLDKDVVMYEIQKKNASITNTSVTNTKIDQVVGRNNTSYTYMNTLALDSIVSIFVGAIDSCKRGSTFNYQLNTMLLKAQYIRCEYKTELVWNSYLSMPGKIKEYQIFYSAGNSAFKKVGSTTSTSFTHSGVDAGKVATYFIRVVNNGNTISASSNRVKFVAYLVGAPNYLYISSASVQNKNSVLLNILIDTSKDSQGIEVQRSEDSVNFKPIGFIPFVGSPKFYFTDENIEPNKKNYYYKLQLKDSCGNNRIVSNICKTILLKVSEDKQQLYIKHLNWSLYQGFAAGVKNYNVYRVINDERESTPFASTSSNITLANDYVEFLSNLGSKIEYVVEAQENITGNPFGISDISNSNLVAIFQEESIFIPSAFAPNGANIKWLPITNFVDVNEYSVTVFDRWGQTVFHTNLENQGWNGGEYPSDIYVYLINYKNSRGEYKQAKGIITLIR